MKLKFWGVRGSINSPLSPDRYKDKLIRILGKADKKDFSNKKRIEKFIESLPINLQTTFGGNTSCVSVSDNETLLIFDAGTGIRNLGSELLAGKFFNPEVKEYYLLFSHLHSDHINGLPFFTPVHLKESKINLYSHHKDFEKLLSVQQDFNFFPISMESRPCEKKFTILNERDILQIGNFTINSKKLNHPNESFSYKIENKNGIKIVYATDAEYTTKSVMSDFFEFFKNADILIFDSQYNFNELAHRYNFGHSTAEIGVDAAVNSNVKTLFLFHHNYDNDDDKISEMYHSACKYREQKYPSSKLEISIANEDMEFNL